MRAALLLACIAVSALAAYYGEPYVSGNSEAIIFLVTVFTVFAGFLVAIVTILGDPALIPSGSWRIAEGRRDNIEARLITHVWLFTLYLIAIGLLFVAIVLQKVPNDVVSDGVKIWIARAYLFFGILSFFLTFSLPRSLLRLQRSRIDAEIERRRREAGIGSSPDPDGNQ
ncbi:MAG: hypothetical protein IT564_05345 [Rhodospirillales bacterium]|nr:hypothetical protein [Rhodospirillales bacterium]